MAAPPTASTTEVLAVAGSLAVLIVLCARWVYSHGYILWYGDAQAHLNIARRIFDSRTPGYRQIGSPWLPVLHVLCLPFVGDNWLWSTGLAGTIPVGVCFVIAGTFFYLALLRSFENRWAAAAGLACLALNPNFLYLASIPMTEAVFMAELSITLFAIAEFRLLKPAVPQWSWPVVLAGISICLATLTRYDGWTLLPVAGLVLAFSAPRRRLLVFVVFCSIASLGPLYWLLHNRYVYGDWLEFYWGPYSAQAIYLRGLTQGLERYRGDHQLGYALQYYWAAGKLCIGTPLFWIGMVGAFAALWKRGGWAILFLLATPLSFISNMYSGQVPIYMPHLYPFSYYNTRYGIAVLPLAAFAAAALLVFIPARLRWLSFALPLLAVAPWVLSHSPENWACWKESEVNSASRRAWTRAAGEYLRANYKDGDQILAPFGDVTGILCYMPLGLRNTVHEDNVPEWYAVTSRLDLYHRQKWAVAQSGDFLARAIDKANTRQTIYQPVLEVYTKNAPVLRVYRRTNASSVNASPVGTPRLEPIP
jgi:hypothetical protein